MPGEKILKEAREKMEKGMEFFRLEVSRLRTGRASLALIDGIKVNYYGTLSPLNQVATLSIPEPRLIVIQPWDPKLIQDIEKAIHASGLGLTPTSDGRVIRLPIPPLTEERRKDLVKVVKKMAEDSRVVLRNIRRDHNESLRKIEKDKLISQDDLRTFQKKLQDIIDEEIKKVDEILAKKEKEILEQ